METENNKTTNNTKTHPELLKLGILNNAHVYENLSVPELYEQAIARHEGLLSTDGALVINTGKYSGRLPKDKFLVKEPTSADKIWWGEVNKPFDPQKFEQIKYRIAAYLQGKAIFIQNCYAGADERYRLPIKLISESASHTLFTRTMLLNDDVPEQGIANPDAFTILHVPYFYADPAIDGTHSEAFILADFGQKLILIGGTAYAGEIKKSVFTVMNYLLPLQQVMAMHCSANYGATPADTAVFFGLSGTGKTTLSADPKRTLIGDDEHGWSDQGVFNFEGGCYAKTIHLSAETEPEIYEATRMFGTILENVVIDPATRQLDFDDASLSENTRAAYPISHIPNMTLNGKGGHPKNIIMLTCDAFGIMPPVAKMTEEQAMYHFLCGYTAKVAGTETGITEPQATFSACFGAPFMALPPTTYAGLLGDKIKQHQVAVWLVNTGWSGGAYGVGKRIKLALTRAMIDAILDGSLANAPMWEEPVFGLQVPQTCAGVPTDILNPRNTWADKTAYDQQAKKLAQMFKANFEKNAPNAAAHIRQAGPKL